MKEATQQEGQADAQTAGKPLRLLAVIEASSITGPAKNLLQFAQLGGEARVETTIATFVRGGENLFTRRVRSMGIPLYTVEEKGAFDRSVIARLREVAREVQPDILQTHAVKSHFLARMAGLPTEFPWVAFHHGYTWTSWKTRMYNELDRWSLRGARRVVTVSKPFRDELAAKGVPLERIEIVHNAISAEWGTAGRDPVAAGRLRGELGIPTEAKVLLIVGRLSREKDHVALLRAVAALDGMPEVYLVIVGDGPERAGLEGFAKELGIEERVCFAGQQASAEPYYGIADVAVLSSRTEGSPNALLEAMAAGVPAVATRVGGIPEIVEDGESALLVEAGDAEALRGALARVLEEPGLGERVAGRATQLVTERHLPGTRVEFLARLYLSTLNSK